MRQKNSSEKSQERVKINNYLTRFALIYTLNITILLSLKYQVGLENSLVFTVIIILSARFTSHKFILDNRRLFNSNERAKLLWYSWSLVWFISIIATTILTYIFAGRETLSVLVAKFSTMPTLEFITNIGIASVISFALLYITYGFNAKREFDNLQKEGKI